MRSNPQNRRELRNSLIAALSAKVLASAVFVSGRTPDEEMRNSVETPPHFGVTSDDSFQLVEVDQEAKEVHIKVNDSPVRTARYYSDQGCVIMPLDATDVFFQPVKVDTSLPDAMTQLWPMGDLLPDKPQPREINGERLNEAVRCLRDPRLLHSCIPSGLQRPAHRRTL